MVLSVVAYCFVTMVILFRWPVVLGLGYMLFVVEIRLVNLASWPVDCVVSVRLTSAVVLLRSGGLSVDLSGLSGLDDDNDLFRIMVLFRLAASYVVRSKLVEVSAITE